MPLDKVELIAENLYLAVWNIQEEENQLQEITFLSPQDETLLADLHHPAKRLEFLAGRALVKAVCEKLLISFEGLLRNEYGKPELINTPYQVSLSHTEKYVVALLSPQLNVGVDIEKPQDKMRRIASRLFNSKEIKFCNDSLTAICKIWSAKEVLFKLYMKGGIDFKKELFISEMNDDFTTCVGTIIKERSYQYQLRFISFHEYIICYNISEQIN